MDAFFGPLILVILGAITGTTIAAFICVVFKYFKLRKIEKENENNE